MHFNQAIENSRNAEELKREFIEQNYPSYKELCDYDVFSLIKQLAEVNDTTSCCEIAVRLQHRRMPKIVRLDYAELKSIENELQEFKSLHCNDFQDWQIMLIQTPHRSYSGEEDPILVANEYGETCSISDFSFMINAISDRLEHIAFLAVDGKIAENVHIVSLMKKLQATAVYL